jgi:hypothetical protein
MMSGNVNILAKLQDANADQAAQNLGAALGTGIFGLILIGVLLSLVFYLPGIIAAGRHAEPAVWILLLNLLLGWTCIGWIVALVWAIVAPSRPRLGTYSPPAAISYPPPPITGPAP